MRAVSLLIFSVLLSYNLHAQRVLAQSEFKAENISSIKIKGSFCDVRITKGDQVYFKGIIEGSGDEDDYEFYSDIDNGSLEIRMVKKGGSWNKLSKSLMELTVTDDVNVYVDNSSGDVYATGFSTERVKLETSSGDIEVSNVNAATNVSATSGDIQLEKVKGDVNSETTSGDQDLYFIQGDVDFDATSGDVTIRSVVGELSGETSSGDVEIYRHQGSIDVRCTSGNIDGQSVIITSDSRFKTSSGDVSIEFDNDMSELSFDLQASSGSLNAGGRKSDRSLYIKEGDIWIYGVTTSGSQRYDN